MNEYKYYCIMRPPMPGGIPKGAFEVCAFRERRYVPEIDRMAWGYVKYTHRLCYAEIREYELISAPMEDEIDG